MPGYGQPAAKAFWKQRKSSVVEQSQSARGPAAAKWLWKCKDVESVESPIVSEVAEGLADEEHALEFQEVKDVECPVVVHIRPGVLTPLVEVAFG